MGDKRGGGATLETEQKESVALPMSCTFFSCFLFFLPLVTQFPSRMCKFGVEVSRLTSLPPSRPTPLLPSPPPPGKLVPESYPFELQ